MDWSEKKLCIKCDKGENLLLCSENGCPLAIHEGCMGCPARFDGEGNFYCPYCLYKQAVAESCQAKENAMSKRKDLLIFINEEMEGSEEHLRNNRAKAKNPNQLEKEMIQEETHQPSDQDPSLKMHEERKIDDVEEEKIEEEKCISSDEDPLLEMNKESKINGVEKEKIHEEVNDTFSASNDDDALLITHVKGKRKFDRSDSEDRGNAVDSVPSKHKKKQKSTTATQILDEKVDASRKSKQLEQPLVKLANDAFMNGRRKRLRWREEEEEMLMVGVKKFSNPEKQNIPWRKILDFGRHVFDETRVPADLKDKWRNMLDE
ncbi:hypothetical protein ACJIZ3_010556 [Penstemon smallii]|uniref:Myb-like domain-containing protein n=1 Tax=Penstemon smallii TaxID=265156 RepID=A0ABD3UGM1_9LAMI